MKKPNAERLLRVILSAVLVVSLAPSVAPADDLDTELGLAAELVAQAEASEQLAPGEEDVVFNFDGADAESAGQADISPSADEVLDEGDEALPGSPEDGQEGGIADEAAVDSTNDVDG